MIPRNLRGIFYFPVYAAPGSVAFDLGEFVLCPRPVIEVSSAAQVAKQRRNTDGHPRFADDFFA